MTSAEKLRIGFLGTGRIGTMRMQSLLDSGLIEAAAIADPSPQMLDVALELAPKAKVVDGLEGLLAEQLDGVVIATPSALHAAQSIQALEAGTAVFCQKPLGRTEAEVAAVVEASRRADRLLGVDLSYRHTAGMVAIRDLFRQGSLGKVFGIDLVFHNAYGPDKPWFFDKALSGGGCVMDLGVHLVDLALWGLDFPEIVSATGNLFSKGQPIGPHDDTVEDYASATLTLAGGTVLRLACSWHLNAGRDAIIEADFYGTQGGASLKNQNGSFFDFGAWHHTGTSSQVLADPERDWPGGAIVDWAKKLSTGARFDPEAEHFTAVSAALDQIYGR
ncbi:Gfo/Idh/MocA family protein [Devosia rhizoryzae]|uniref:Gfo/Idh/MocA family oxidoreductase n=1 Tax=Devosia rhizoryzae TaxID=2774137 RepID=A0ABX7C5X9_9HYPH|nr:Gfo/Idh/MocA family oxidoreductase [Devosia rhizoryzae]QQR38035.1 Gfo/Idh/MocA family oxidoreductase [Devosia rhizoryzae]